MATPMVRLISFRLSEEEYQEMKRLCADEGSRSLSDFVRSAFHNLIRENGHLETVLELKLRKIDQRLADIQREFKELSALVETAGLSKKPADTGIVEKTQAAGQSA
ncbi:MAG TPA: ribbon-helix-helix protein, CopG family [Bryobacteraceae bacterium]|nr:ribbon-helix-helix protein, CopG family [Bryobacteraceae bacterium]HOQ44670.1 ribbon-helix-helix protein, CopG family [Bryobacteraceae bacterium]HPU71880.1 ribbon-helix-helix protein, CopG family [Bryobacteraceae bacterium]